MSEMIFVVGLPGSGKTHLAQKLYKQGNWIVFDDMDSNKLVEVKSFIKKNWNVIITDPHLCRSAIRYQAEQTFRAEGVTKFEWVYFANDPEQCLANVERRNDGRRVANFIQILTKLYNPPAGQLLVRVYNPDNDPPDVDPDIDIAELPDEDPYL